MGAYNSVPVNMYEEGFASLSADEQRIEYMFRTSPHRASEGLFRCPLGYIEEDIGMDRDTARVAIEAVVAKRPFRYDFEAGVVLDLRALYNNPLRNGVAKKDSVTKGGDVIKKGDVVKDNRMPGAISRLRALPPTRLLVSLYEIAAVASPDFAREMEEQFQGIDLGAPIEAPSEAPTEAPTEGGWQAPSRARAEAISEAESRIEDSQTGPIDDEEASAVRLVVSKLHAEDVTDDPRSLHRRSRGTQ